EKVLSKKRDEENVEFDHQLSTSSLKELVNEYKELIKSKLLKNPPSNRIVANRIKEREIVEFPQNPWEQLLLAIDAVISSWNNPRAVEYRKEERISDKLCTAVNIQAMVFGNTEGGGTGVCFTRNVETGEKELYGEFLPNAQGEDVVAGVRTPLPIKEMEKMFPDIYRELLEIGEKLEKHYRDVQDFEFTIDGSLRKLFILQTRTAKRTPRAAVKIAVDMAKEGLISKEEAIMRVEPDQIDKLLHPRIDESKELRVIAKGIPASPGAASGIVVFDPDRAEELREKGEEVILVRPETSADDVHGIKSSVGVLTAKGGRTSHAAVVTRGWGIPCVVGCEEMRIDDKGKYFETESGVIVKEGERITIDGTTGNVILGKAPMLPPEITPEMKELLGWATEISELEVRANADTPEDARKAREFGAKGIGLCRTEHMFFGEGRIERMRKVIMAVNEKERRKALRELMFYQIEDFKKIFNEMEGLPVTIRLLDPPLHEFLPNPQELLEKVILLKIHKDFPSIREELMNRKEYRGIIEEILSRESEIMEEYERVKTLEEKNPMMGFRGCRLGIAYPEIFEMQVEAIMRAACSLKKEGREVYPEIMVPLTMHESEMKILRELIEEVAERVMREEGVRVHYTIGTMIETPRAAIVGDKLAEYSDFFSFGTNDLTQMTMALSRDDYGPIITQYLEKEILEEDPFFTLDLEGVGELIKICVEKSKGKVKIGVCGEHGGDPRSIRFFHEIGVDYVSCSPYRVPVAILSGARSTLESKRR
ncbi:pyruvate, phosphate dikinase, partial [Thermococci archaeon]